MTDPAVRVEADAPRFPEKDPSELFAREPELAFGSYFTVAETIGEALLQLPLRQLFEHAEAGFLREPIADVDDYRRRVAELRYRFDVLRGAIEFAAVLRHAEALRRAAAS